MISSMDEINEQARVMRHLANFALTVLLDRAGGSLTVTQPEYEAVLGRFVPGGDAVPACTSEGRPLPRTTRVRGHGGELPSWLRLKLLFASHLSWPSVRPQRARETTVTEWSPDFVGRDSLFCRFGGRLGN